MKAPIFVCAIFCLIINGCVSINQYNKALIANVNQRKSIEKLNKKLTDLLKPGLNSRKIHFIPIQRSEYFII